MSAAPYQIGIIGAGNMGEALIRGLLRSRLVGPKNLIASGRRAKQCRKIHQKYKIATTQDNTRLVRHSRTIILAVKPQNIDALMPQIAPHLNKRHLVISIAAGVPVAKLKKGLKGFKALVRVMPNLPSLIECGIAGIYCTSVVSRSQKRFAHKIFEAVGKTVDIGREKWMDAVTGLSGTGPAYLFAMIEALTKAGEKLGLPKKEVRILTLETMLGAAQLALKTKTTAEELRKRVTSKKGTTWAAMKVFKKHRFWDTLVKAVIAATKRSHELRGK